MHSHTELRFDQSTEKKKNKTINLDTLTLHVLTIDYLFNLK